MLRKLNSYRVYAKKGPNGYDFLSKMKMIKETYPLSTYWSTENMCHSHLSLLTSCSTTSETLHNHCINSHIDDKIEKNGSKRKAHHPLILQQSLCVRDKTFATRQNMFQLPTYLLLVSSIRNLTFTCIATSRFTLN